MVVSDVTQLGGFFKTKEEAEEFSKQISEDCIMVDFWAKSLWWVPTKNALEFMLNCFKEKENGS